MISKSSLYFLPPFLSLCAVLAVAQNARVRTAGQSEPRGFDRVLLLEEKGETSAGVSIGDVDGDGFLDVVLAKGRHTPLYSRVLLNDGKGKFTGSNLGEEPGRTYSAALADLNGDGSPDIVFTRDRPDAKLIYLNAGRGRFRLAGSFGDPSWPTRYVTLADLNGDGRPDIVAANRGPGKFAMPSYVCLNDGKGGFPVCRPLPIGSATIIVASDFDGDGAIDLLIPHRDGGQSIVVWNDGKGSFSEQTNFSEGQTSARAAAAGDLDGDGLPDVVVGDEQQGTFLYLNAGHRRFHPPVPLAGKDREVYAVAIADLNRDGHMDIVTGNVEQPCSVFYNVGRGKAFREIRWNDGKGSVYGLAIGDLDGDGWPDIAAARSGASNGLWFSTPVAGRKVLP